MALCASHIGNVRRASYMRSMLRSWSRQTWRPHMYLSISWDEHVTPIVERVLHEMEAEEDLTILRQGQKRMSQFEHYNDISKRLSGDDTWVFFSDDDDLWHEHRAAVLMSSVLSASDDILSIKMSGTVTGKVGGETSADIWGALEAGRMHALEAIQEEYWMYSCRLGALKDFVGRASPELLAHPYCDMYLVKYLKYSEGFKTGLMSLPPGVEWLYAYRDDVGRGDQVSNRSIMGMTDAGLRNVMIAIYASLPHGYHDEGVHRKKARASCGQFEPGMKKGTRMVRQGRLDAFVFSPMP